MTVLIKSRAGKVTLSQKIKIVTIKKKMNQSLLLEQLRVTLTQVSEFHSGQIDFIRDFNLLLKKKEVINKALPRNFTHKILKGKMRFERGEVANYLPEALAIAENILKKHKKEKEKRDASFDFSKTYKNQLDLNYIEERLNISSLLINSGEATLGIRDLLSLQSIVNFESLSILKPRLYADFYVLLASCKVHRGETLLALPDIDKSLKVLKKLPNEKQYLVHALSVKALLTRQQGLFEETLILQKQATKLVDILPLTENLKTIYRADHEHNIAVTLLRQSELNNTPLSENAKKIISNSYDCAITSNSEAFFHTVALRKAEILLNYNELSDAEKILDIYEDPTQLILLNKTLIAAFFKINVERYLAKGDIIAAIKYFKAGVEYDLREHFHHNLLMLEHVYHKSTLLKQNLPEGFSVFKPQWKI